MKRKRIRYAVIVAVLLLTGIIICLFFMGRTAYAKELTENAIDADFLYSKYSLKNYQLDFYVDTSGGWLPWNWGDSIGKGVMYGLYMITNGFWSINTNISSLVGSAVAEVYNLDLIGGVVDVLGKNLQTIAGVSPKGFSSKGLYVRFLPWFVLLTGIYIMFCSVKHETSKAFSTTINMILVFVLSASFIAYSPDYIKAVNEFSAETGTAMLDVGTKILVPESNTTGGDSEDIIRENLFAIQVYKPWLLLQYGTTNVEEIGQDRIDSLLSINPSEGEARENAVIEEVETHDNMNMSIPEVAGRLGDVLLLLIINIIISIFVLLFIAFAMFLPLSFLISMIPGQGGKWKQAVMKLFNILIMRVGISFILTVTFCLSSMVYAVTANKPFLLIGILQIMVFAGIYMKMNELLNLASISDNGESSMRRGVINKARMYGRRFAGKHFKYGMAGGLLAGSVLGRARAPEAKTGFGGSGGNGHTSSVKSGAGNRTKQEYKPKEHELQKENLGNKLGHTVGKIKDTPARMKDNIKKPFEKVKDIPVNASYGLHSFKKGIQEEVKTGKQTRADRQEERQKLKNEKKQEIAAMQKKTTMQSGIHNFMLEKEKPKPETAKAETEKVKPETQEIPKTKAAILQSERNGKGIRAGRKNWNDLGEISPQTRLNGEKKSYSDYNNPSRMHEFNTTSSLSSSAKGEKKNEVPKRNVNVPHMHDIKPEINPVRKGTGNVPAKEMKLPPVVKEMKIEKEISGQKGRGLHDFRLEKEKQRPEVLKSGAETKVAVSQLEKTSKGIRAGRKNWNDLGKVSEGTRINGRGGND